MPTAKQYWIADGAGVHALVIREERDVWVGHFGWHDAALPGPDDQVRVVRADGLRGCIPFAAIADGWADLGWAPGAPPMPVDVTKDPAPVAEPAEPQTKAAAGGQSKEK
jgi:hypothetical protein